MDFETAKLIGGFIGSMFIFGFSIVKVLDRKAEDRQSRLEKRHQREMDSIRQDITDKYYQSTQEFQNVHNRVNDVKDNYVKQDTHDRDINMIRTSITEFRSEMKQDLLNGINTFNEGLSAMRKDFTEYLMKLSERTKHLD